MCYSLVWDIEVHDVLHRLPGQTEVHHPVHEVEGDEHDGEDDPAVLVDVTGAHPEYSCRGPRGQRGRGHGEQGRACLLATHVRALSLLTWQRVHPVIDCTREHTTRVEPHTGLEHGTRDYYKKKFESRAFVKTF